MRTCTKCGHDMSDHEMVEDSGRYDLVGYDDTVVTFGKCEINECNCAGFEDD